MEQLKTFFENLSGWVWGTPLVMLLFGTHLYLTLRTGFIQKHLFRAIKLSLSKEEGKGDVSHFASLMTALAATIGTGNIVGVATAITVGGPGAVLWMWLTGVFGIATKYSEALLSVKYRITMPNGQMAGGPMYVLENALKLKWLAVLFAVFTALASFGIGNMSQAHSISSLMENTFQINPYITGLILTTLTAIVILGGIKSIAKVCSYLVPFMAIAYVAGCLGILIVGRETLWATVELICRSAFTGHAALGGFMGAGVKEAARYGIARGLFSNESGLGSAPIVAAAAKSKDPVTQALVSSTATFWDTVVICAMTGLVLVNTVEWHGALRGASLTKEAFATYGSWGTYTLTIGLFTFVFSTILGWSYYGEKAVEYLFGAKAIMPYRWAWVAVVMLGSIAPLSLVWDFSDAMNGLMAVPNLISLILLSGTIASETKRYFSENP
jgi:AGCS family alanine or glycine:cation symporter